MGKKKRKKDKYVTVEKAGNGTEKFNIKFDPLFAFKTTRGKVIPPTRVIQPKKGGPYRRSKHKRMLRDYLKN
ncbi:MAG: hypothetical protein PHN69_05230 [Candidatus Pacebacteria bacterium]|nr:hypothetical protein [Candidatus Paceibacterota bacterium]